jgi:hypothetical protein
MHLVNVEIELQPVYHEEPPDIRVGVNDFMTPWILDTTRKFSFKFYAESQSILQVEFVNKRPGDTVVGKNLDKAVIVKSVSFFDITDPKFAWAGMYQTQHSSNAVSQTYLSWNGTWTLRFDVPVFTWMHHVQGLGWIYQ